MLSHPVSNLGETPLLSAARRPRAEQAAQEFEALLLSHLLRTVREAGQDDKDPEIGMTGSQTYFELAEQHLAMAMAQRGGLGLANMLVLGLKGGLNYPGPLADKISEEAQTDPL